MDDLDAPPASANVRLQRQLGAMTVVISPFGYGSPRRLAGC